MPRARKWRRKWPWSAVKEKYQKGEDGSWHAKEESRAWSCGAAWFVSLPR